MLRVGELCQSALPPFRCIEKVLVQADPFSDPVAKQFIGKPANLKTKTPLEQKYRQSILQAIVNGKGQEIGERSPSFAGHYLVAQWQCGPTCMMMVLVDEETGDIYGPPLCSEPCGTKTFALPMLRPGFSVSKVEFLQNSRLLKITVSERLKSIPAEKLDTYYFLWQNARWTLLQRESTAVLM